MKRHGEGKIVTTDGTVFKGQFSRGKKNGKGLLYEGNKVFELVFDNGNLIEWWELKDNSLNLERE